MGKTYTEAKLPVEVGISISRYRKEDGSLDYRGTVSATTLTDKGEPVRDYHIDIADLVKAGLLEKSWVERAKRTAAHIVQAAAQYLDVGEA